MSSKIPARIAGWDSILFSLKQAFKVGPWAMLKALLSKNSCKSCALGMGGQEGGMRDEKGVFPSVCKKAVWAQASDLQPALPEDFFQRHSIAELKTRTPMELEYSGRLTTPALCIPGDSHYQPISWEEAMDLVVDQLKSTPADRSFFYASGRSSNEAGFILQLFARVFGTNNVNNCSYYCHQASGVGLSQSLGTGTATIQLEDLDHTDLIFLIGANPSSNHPRFMRTLMDIRRRSGKVVVINPARERGLEKFYVPSDVRSLLFGSKIASTYIQPNINGDLPLCTGIAKALLQMADSQPAILDRVFIDEHTDHFNEYRHYVENTSWDELESLSGVSRTQMEQLAQHYATAKNVVFAWAMGITHHANGVEGVQAIVNLALLRGMLGRKHAGLLPLRGHSNVQGIGTIGFTPQLKQEFMDNLESAYGIHLPTGEGMDTLACMEAAHAGQFDFAWNLGGNLYGSNPDSRFAEEALSKIGFALYMNTTLNPSHFQGRGKTTLILPVLARDEEPEPTTQESMFSYVRMSNGGPSRYPGLKSEVEVIAEIARRVMPDSPIPWKEFQHTSNIRQVIGSVVKGMKPMQEIDRTHKEFHIEGRILHKAQFPSANGKAVFKVPQAPVAPLKADHFRMMTVRSEGQFNTVVYETQDKFRGVDSRDVVLMNPKDIEQRGWQENDTVTVKNTTGSLTGQKLIPYPITPGNIMMYYPEANVLVPRTADPQSRTPSFKSIEVLLEKE